MLKTSKLVAFVGITNRDNARAFYKDVLGLPLVSEDPFAMVFDANGTMLRVTPVPKHVAAGYTVLGWDVDDVAAMAKTLAGKGVKFERYEGMNQDAAGIWSAPSGAKVCWFKDGDGNLLSLSQFAKD